MKTGDFLANFTDTCPFLTAASVPYHIIELSNPDYRTRIVVPARPGPAGKGQWDRMRQNRTNKKSQPTPYQLRSKGVVLHRRGQMTRNGTK